MAAPIFEAFAERGIDATAVGKMEIWVIAASLGVDEAELENEDILARRMAAAKAGENQPSWDDIRNR